MNVEVTFAFEALTFNEDETNKDVVVTLVLNVFVPLAFVHVRVGQKNSSS